MTKSILDRRILLLVPAWLVLGATIARGQFYSVVDLTPNGGEESEALSISNNGYVAGTWETADYANTLGFRYRDGVTNNLGAIGGFVTSSGAAVNDAGRVAGTGYYVDETTNAFRAFVSDEEGLFSLGTLPGKQSSYATAINASSTVVGYSATHFTSDGEAFISTETGLLGLGKLGTGLNYHSAAYAINDQDIVVGTANAYPGQTSDRAFVWDAQQGMRNLGTFRGDRSYGRDVNNANQVVVELHHEVVGGPQLMSARLDPPAGYGSTVQGIDVSHWQGTINWNKVWESGVDFAFIKATEDVAYASHKVQYYNDNAAAATRAGVAVGAYHFAQPSLADGDAQAEANYFVDTILPSYQSGTMHMRPVLDLEVNPANMSWEELGGWASTFVQTVRDRLTFDNGYYTTTAEPILYVNSNYAQNLDTYLADDVDLWIAHYSSAQDAPRTGDWGNNWLAWQYSETERVDGIAGNVDGNVLSPNIDMSSLLIDPFNPFEAPQGPTALVYDLDDGSVTYLRSDTSPLSPRAINDRGEVVGNSYDVTTVEYDGEEYVEYVESAFIHRNGRATDLNSLLPADSPWRIIAANDINSAGQIAALGVLKDDDPFDYDRPRALLLTPDPASVPTQLVQREPDAALLTVRQPSSDQLRILSEDGQVLLTRPTIVLSHGWNSSPDSWPADLAGRFRDLPTDVNIVAWDWEDDAATGPLFSVAGSRTPAQGRALADALAQTLGTQYGEVVHFLGHSFGSLVNRYAADAWHDMGYDPDRTQVTIFDSADLGLLNLASWAGPMPRRAAWVDNYVTAFGQWHDDAVNILLLQELPTTINGNLQLVDALSDYHGYPMQWYAPTITHPGISVLGNAWSIERGTLSGAPGLDTAWLQTPNPDDDPYALQQITPSQFEDVLLVRNTLYGLQATNIAFDLFATGPVQFVGSVAVELIDPFTDDLVERSIRMILRENSPSYAWLPLSVPMDADFLSLDFILDDMSQDDLFTLGINDQLLFAMDGDSVVQGIAFSTGLIDISAYAGQDIELFIGLVSDGATGGEITVENFQFHTLTVIPEPATAGLLVVFAMTVLARKERE